jgi:hypothetical protein
MRSLGAAHLLVLVGFVVLVLDSRRLHALARSNGRGRRDSISGHGLPAGANPDQVGLPLRQIQMRIHVDWQDGGIGWEGPEILPVDEPDGAPVDTDTTPDDEPNPARPVLWKPFPALPAAGAAGDWPQAERPARSDPGSWADGPPALTVSASTRQLVRTSGVREFVSAIDGEVVADVSGESRQE